MSHYHFGEVSNSNQIVVASMVPSNLDQRYELQHKKYPHIYIPNRAVAIGLSCSDEQSKAVVSLRRDVEEYNTYLDNLEKIPGFLQFFQEHGYCVSREDVTQKWSKEIADQVFSLRRYRFYTELVISCGYLMDVSIHSIYQMNIDHNPVSISFEESDDGYPQMIGGKRTIWNWISNGHDFCAQLWVLLYEIAWDQLVFDGDDRPVSYCFDVYNEFRGEDPEPQLVKIFRKLESLGYLESYTLKSEKEDPRWFYEGKEDGTIDVALIDMSFEKNSLLMEQIKLLLWQPTEEVMERQYFLTDCNRNQYISDHCGAFGGHNKLKIYGRLDCPSANRYIANGQYVRHRVFFDSEKTAIEAGYRPCAVCMPKEYRLWKEKEEKEEVRNKSSYYMMREANIR